MSRDTYQSHPLRSSDSDSSISTPEGRRRLRQVLLERARKTVDPNKVGFDALMVTDDPDFFPTDEGDYLDLIDPVINVIFEGAVRLGLAVITAGVAIAAAHMFTSEAGSRYATTTLLVAAAFAVAFVVSAFTGRRR